MLDRLRKRCKKLLSKMLRYIFCDDVDGMDVELEPKVYWKYLCYEFRIWRQGDKRDDFEKLVERCHMLKSRRDIFNAA